MPLVKMRATFAEERGTEHQSWNDNSPATEWMRVAGGEDGPELYRGASRENFGQYRRQPVGCGLDLLLEAEQFTHLAGRFD